MFRNAMFSTPKLAHLLMVTMMLALVCATAAAADVPAVGDPAPAFNDALGTDQAKHSLDEYADAKLVLMVFTCNGCPVSQANEQRVIDLQKDYADKGVQVVAVNVNLNSEDSFENMQAKVEQRGFNFPYLYDPQRAITKAYGARKTSHVFLLDQDRHIAYAGALDDSPLDPTSVKKQYARDAIDALLAGKKPEVTSTRPQGCSVPRR